MHPLPRSCRFPPPVVSCPSVRQRAVAPVHAGLVGRSATEPNPSTRLAVTHRGGDSEAGLGAAPPVHGERDRKRRETQRRL